MIEFNIGSSEHLSLLLFGGKYKVNVPMPVLDENNQPIVIKSGINKGKIKTKLKEQFKRIKGLGCIPKEEWKLKKEGMYSTNEDTLLEVFTLGGEAGKIAELMLKIRGLEKQISTYYDSLEKVLYEDGRIHPSFIHVSTETTRLSSKNPNAQNQPSPASSNVRQHFTSRFEGGKIVAADYRQMEITVQAELSKDEQLTKDILSGVDFHTKRLATKERITYDEAKENLINEETSEEWKEKRKKIKNFSFARAFGGGANLISFKTGLTVDEVKELIRNEDLMYPGVVSFNDFMSKWVECTAEVSEDGKTGYYESPTKCRFVFKGGEPYSWQKQKGITINYDTKAMKNYIIQGTAANIFSTMVGKFYREVAINKRDKYLIINMIHDDIVLDCKEEYVEELRNDLKMLENVKEMMYTEYSYDFELPISIDVRVGSNWWEV